MIHIALEHLYFKSRREEWAVRVWRDVKYKAPNPLALASQIPSGEGEIQQKEM